MMIEFIIIFLVTLTSIFFAMEYVYREVLSYLPKPFSRTFNKVWNGALASQSRIIRFFLCVCMRLILVQACLNLFIYTAFVGVIDFLVGKWIRKLNIIPFETHCRGEVREDPGVVEMRAMLRGEDCFDHHLEQSQMRPALPPDFNPYTEVHLVSLHLYLSNSINRLHASLSSRRGPTDRFIHKISSRFDDFFLHQFASSEVINKRS